MEFAQPKQLVVVVVVVMVALIMMVHGSEAQLCNMSASGLKACKPSACGPSPVPPSATCCSALSKADFQCLCNFYKNSKLVSSLGIDPDLALQLPQKCNCPQPVKC